MKHAGRVHRFRVSNKKLIVRRCKRNDSPPLNGERATVKRIVGVPSCYAIGRVTAAARLPQVSRSNGKLFRLGGKPERRIAIDMEYLSVERSFFRIISGLRGKIKSREAGLPTFSRAVMSRVVHRRQPDVIRGANEHRSAITFNPNWRFVSDERQIRLHQLMRNEFENNDWKRGQIG